MVVVLIGSYGLAWLYLSGKLNWPVSFHKGGVSGQSSSIKDCSAVSNENFLCYKERYTSIVQNKSVSEAFMDLKQAYEKSASVQSQCHQITHVIGRLAGRKYDDVASAYESGDSFCWSGYYHGVLEAVADKMGSQGLVDNINSICKTLKDKQEYAFDHFNCVHGIGHGLMAVQNSELFTSLASCDQLFGSWQQDSCYGGVFMENIMDTINPNHHTNYLKDDDPLYPCTAVTNRYKEQCYLMQTSHALGVLDRDFGKVFDVCSKVEAPYDVICFQSLGRDASGQTTSNKEKTVEICDNGPSVKARTNCFVGAVKDFISYFHSDKQGLDMCTAITDSAVKSKCISTAYEYYKTF